MDLSDDSQQDMFANTQVQTRNEHVTDSNPDKWTDTDFEYPMLIIFRWGGQADPFILSFLVELDPEDVNVNWLNGILSPTSRCKHRNLKAFPDFSVSIYSKVQKSRFTI